MSAHTASTMRRPSMRKITIAGAIGAVKGVCTVSDAKLAVELGADAVILSNHGGRQLDRAVAPIAMVADVRAALGPEVEILVDSGIRSGVDIAAAVASGAQWLPDWPCRSVRADSRRTQGRCVRVRHSGGGIPPNHAVARRPHHW